MRKVLRVLLTTAMIFALTGSALVSSTEPVLAAAKLKVTPKSKVIYIGDTIKLKSNLKVKWSVSKGGKIKLSSKKSKTVKVKAVKAGTAYVTAKRGKTVKKVKITVRSRVPSSIRLKANRTVIGVYETSVVSLKSVKPSYASKDVKWSTSDKEIATVNKYGLVTGISPGTVRITATSRLSSKIKGSVTITVEDVTRGTITTEVEMTDPEKYPEGKIARVWVPMPAQDEPYQKISHIKYSVQSTEDTIVEETVDSAGNKALYVEWGPSVAPANRKVTLKYHVERREVICPDDLASLEKGEVDKEAFAEYLKETNWSGSFDPDGIVKKKADEIVAEAGAETVYDKAYAIYDWVIENLTRDYSTPGLGKGDVEYILTHLDGGIGKCTDVNSVFDALCRAEGIPARGIFGLKFNTCGQKCKPQFYLPGYGWVDADPSQVLNDIKDHEDEYRGENAPKAKEWALIKDHYWGAADANWFMFTEGRDIELSPRQSATEADPDGFLNNDGTLNYFVFPYAEYDGQYLMSHSKKLFPYTYTFEEDEDCGC